MSRRGGGWEEGVGGRRGERGRGRSRGGGGGGRGGGGRRVYMSVLNEFSNIIFIVKL